MHTARPNTCCATKAGSHGIDLVKNHANNGWRSFRTLMKATSVGKKVRTFDVAFARM